MTESHLEFYHRWQQLSKPYFEWQMSQLKPFLGSRVADLGCGLGNLTHLLLDRELYVGIDCNPIFVGELETRFSSNKNIKAFNCDITESKCSSLLNELNIDSILSVNVIEHIENDIAALNNMVEALPLGGTLCLLVPAMHFLYGTLDTLDGHFRRYSKKTLREKLGLFPLKIEKMYYFNFIGMFGWFLKGRILKEKKQKDENFLLMNLIIPIMSRIEKICKPPCGMSLIAIARRI